MWNNSRFESEFDVKLNKAQRFMFVWFILCAGVSLGLIGFIIWVVVMLMKYFGVI